MDIYGDSNPKIVQDIINSIFQIRQYTDDVADFLDDLGDDFLGKVLDELNF